MKASNMFYPLSTDHFLDTSKEKSCKIQPTTTLNDYYDKGNTRVYNDEKSHRDEEKNR